MSSSPLDGITTRPPSPAASGFAAYLVNRRRERAGLAHVIRQAIVNDTIGQGGQYYGWTLEEFDGLVASGKQI